MIKRWASRVRLAKGATAVALPRARTDGVSARAPAGMLDRRARAPRLTRLSPTPTELGPAPASKPAALVIYVVGTLVGALFAYEAIRVGVVGDDADMPWGMGHWAYRSPWHYTVSGFGTAIVGLAPIAWASFPRLRRHLFFGWAVVAYVALLFAAIVLGARS